MIKFKNILQKASFQAGHLVGIQSLSADFTGNESLAAAFALSQPGTARALESAQELVVESAPTAPGSPVRDATPGDIMGGASFEAASTETQEPADALTLQALEAIAAEEAGAADFEAPLAADESQGAGLREEALTAQEGRGEADALGRLIDDVLKEPAAAVEKEEAAPLPVQTGIPGQTEISGQTEVPFQTETPGAACENTIETGDDTGGGIDVSFMEEVDRLLSEFGQLSPETLAAAASQAAAQLGQDAVETTSAGEPGLSGDEEAEQSDVHEAVSSLEKEALAAFEMDAAAGGQEGEGSDDLDLPPSQVRPAGGRQGAPKQAAQPGAVDKTGKKQKGSQDKKTAGSRAAGDAAVDDGEDTRGEADLDALGEALTSAEKEALVDEGSNEDAAEAARMAGAAAREVDDLFADGGEQVGEDPGEAKEVEIDFSQSAGALSGKADEAPPAEMVDTNDLLSKVLGDLDKLGDVSKPEKESKAGEEEPMDFSAVLDDLQEDTPEPAPQGDAGAKGAKAAARKPAKKATEEPPAEPALDEEPEDRVAPDEEIVSPDELVNEILEETLEEAPAEEAAESPDSGDSDSGDDDAGDSAGAGGGAADDILSSLQASKQAADKTAGDQRDARPPKAIGKEEKAQEEDVRRELLSRSKEVEQKVLDEIFGADKEKFRSQVKTEMASAASRTRETSGSSAMDQEAARQTKDAAEQEAPAEIAQPSMLQSARDKVGACLVQVALLINRPFERWMSPPARQILTVASISLIAVSFITLLAVVTVRCIFR